MSFSAEAPAELPPLSPPREKRASRVTKAGEEHERSRVNQPPTSFSKFKKCLADQIHPGFCGGFLLTETCRVALYFPPGSCCPRILFGAKIATGSTTPVGQPCETSCPDNKNKAVGRLKTERLALCLQPTAKMIGFSFVWLHSFGTEQQAERQAGQLTRQRYQSSVPIVMS